MLILSSCIAFKPIVNCTREHEPLSAILRGFLVCVWGVWRWIHIILYCIITKLSHTGSDPLRVQFSSVRNRTQAVFDLDPAQHLLSLSRSCLLWFGGKPFNISIIPVPYLQPWPETFPPLSQLEVLTGKEGRMNVKKELIVSMTRRKSQSSARRSWRRSRVSCEACKGQIYLRKV